MDPNASDQVEEKDDDMSSLAAGFSAWMHKQAASV